MSSRVKDGATLRHERVLNMLWYIESSGSEGAALREVQSFMLERYGLKFDTSAAYVRECVLAGFIKEDGGALFVTERYKKFRSE